MSVSKELSAKTNELRDSDRVAKDIQPPGYEIWCNWCGSAENLRRCGRCHRAFYCSKEHQRSHWKNHRQECEERARPEDVHPSNDRDVHLPTQPTSTFTNLDYTTSPTCTTTPIEPGNTSNVTTQPEFNPLLDVTSLNAEQIAGLLPNVEEDNFNSIDLGILLGDNLSDVSDWSTVSYEEGTITISPVPSNVDVPVQAQGSPRFSIQQENMPPFSQLPEPPPYEFTENSSFVASNLVPLDINITNQENRNVIAQPVEPNRLQIQQFLYELSDLTNTENVCRDTSSDSAPLPLSILTPEFLSRVCSNIVNDMNQFGICVIDNFLGRKTGEAILAEVKELYSDGIFEEGQVVNTNHRTISKTIRGDRITWVNGKEENCRFVGFLIHILDTIVTRCLKLRNSGSFGKCKVNRRTKAMIACYPGNGTHYVKHVDNPNQDGRCITTIYYLNQFWDTQRHGGLLRMFPAGCDNQVANIEPLFDRILFFWSDRRNPHEVLPAFSVRFAITVWYCNAEESKNVIQRCMKELPKQNTEAQGLKQHDTFTN